MATRGFVDQTDDEPLVAQAARVLIESGCPVGEASWLAEVMLDPQVLPPRYAGNREQLTRTAWHRLDALGKAIKQAEDRDAGVLLGFEAIGVAPPHAMRSINHHPFAFVDDEVSAFVSLCQSRGVDFTRALVRASKLVRHLPLLVQPLWSAGAFDVSVAVDWLQVESLADQGWHAPVEGSPWDSAERSDPKTLVFWLKIGGATVLQQLMPRVLSAKEAGPEQLARVARALGFVISSWRTLPNGELRFPDQYEVCGPEFQDWARQVFDVIDQAVESAPSAAVPELRESRFRYSLMAFEGRAVTPPNELRKRLREAAADEIGRLRPLFRRASDLGAADEFRNSSGLYQAAVRTLFAHGSLWEILRPLVLAFRALGHQAVAADLRVMYDLRRDGPARPAWVGWSEVPMNIFAAIHNRAGAEQAAGDPELLDVRTEFARFCLERLKPAKARGTPANPDKLDPHPVEADPIWREAFVRAVRALRVNPDGKGQRVLFHVYHNDSDLEVRESAKTTYEEMRARWTDAKRVSPRTLLLRAFGCLRQGHLLSLGVKLDQAGVQRTLDEERRWTTEPEEDSRV